MRLVTKTPVYKTLDLLRDVASVQSAMQSGKVKLPFLHSDLFLDWCYHQCPRHASQSWELYWCANEVHQTLSYNGGDMLLSGCC